MGLTACDLGVVRPGLATANADIAGHSQVQADWLSRFDLALQAAQQANRIPGMAVAVVEGDHTLLAKGYGLRDVENKLPVDADTLFHIASTQKSMNALLIATLVDDGVVEWDAPVVQYYSDFQLSSAASTQRVTLRHLLSMSSGLPGEAEASLPLDADVQDVFEVARQATLLAQPAEQFSYSNLSASIAGYIAVMASVGNDQHLLKDYARLLRERVLQPIGMSRSTTQISLARQAGNLAKPYAISWWGSAVQRASIDSDEDILAPAGSLKSSAKDMARYLSTQLGHGLAPNQTRVVAARQLRETWQPVLNGYALGWLKTNYNGMEALLHTGSFDGYASVIVLLPAAQMAFVLLANSAAAEGLTESVHKSFIDALQRRSNEGVF